MVLETLSDREGPNSLQHAMIPATTEACIIASAGLDTLSPATMPCLLSLVPGTPA